MGYTIIQNETITNQNISDGAFRVLTFLTSMCFGEKVTCHPSQQTIAKELGKSVRTIQRYISELVKAGLISIKRRGSTSNKYTVMQKITQKAAQNIHAKAKELVNKAKLTINNKKSKKEDNFNNFEQRTYDFDRLERQLLGWEKGPITARDVELSD